MSKYHAPALDKGLDILEYLSRMAIPQSQVEISAGIGKTSNEIYRMLVCLEERGYLLKDSVSGRYSLSLKLFQLAHRHTPIDGLIKTSKPLMMDLSNTTKQSSHLGILHNNKLMVVSQSRSPGAVTLSIEEGSLFPLTLTTSGRVLLAFLGEADRTKILDENEEYKSFTSLRKKRFNSLLEKIREEGIEICKSEITAGVTDIAVPIGSADQGFIAALAISSLTTVEDQNISMDFLTHSIRKTAEKINKLLGTED